MPHKTTHKPASKNAIEVLTNDHKEVLQLFSDFETLKKADELNEGAKRSLVEKTCSKLTHHLQVEEEFFYPALRDAFEDMTLVDEAEVEHSIANQLISELESMEPSDDFYDAKFTVLGEYIRHHIAEEQERIFPKAKKFKVDLIALGTDILQRKQELRAESDLPEEAQGNTESRQHKRNHRPSLHS